MSVSPETVAPMTDINSYLSFCLKLFLVFGLTFEIPIITLILILIGVVSDSNLGGEASFYYRRLFFCRHVCHATRCAFDDHAGHSHVDAL